ncbi:hypothetical protein GCM10009799_02260 [Nocardiopsis rhodophaea]|uniref:OmpR/PhoB-type domain-containing protein n=1 Tax=Nocardiopsis rhodophaea TaxID=280238 RepID=A0ABN2S6P5_9ACTN
MNSLVDELWDASPPKLARKTVQTYVYQLRKELAAQGAGQRVIESRPQGYMIRLSPGELDYWDFQTAVDQGWEALRQGDSRAALDLLRGALALWRGPALADIGLGPLLSAQVAHLEGVRLRLQEEIIDVALRLGEYRGLIAELERLITANPLHEGFHAQLMMALAGRGDRSGALDVFQRLRARIADELGLDPSERLVDLQRELIQGTLEVAPAAELPAEPAEPAGKKAPRMTLAQLPPDCADFVGRRQELSAITGAFQRARGTAPAVMVVAGQTGAGKTTLAVRAGHLMRSDFPDGQLFASLSGPVEPFDVLGSFLRATGVPPDQIPEQLPERVNLYRSWTAERRVLVVLDDAAYVQRLTPLVPAGPDCAVLITSRVGLPGLAGASVVTVGPLPAEDGVQLLDRVAGGTRAASEPEAAHRLVALCDNLPLAVRAAGEKLAARPPWPVQKLVTRMLDSDRRLQELVTGQLNPSEWFENACLRLSPSYRWALLRLCSIGPVAFPLDQAAEVLGTDPGSAECPVAELVDAHLLRVVGTTDGGAALFRFPDLIRIHVLSRDDAQASAPTPPESVSQWTLERTRTATL